LRLGGKASPLAVVVGVPHLYRLAEQALKAVAEGAGRAMLLGQHRTERALDMRQALLLAHPSQLTGIVAAPPIRHQHARIVGRNHLAHFRIAIARPDLLHGPLHGGPSPHIGPGRARDAARAPVGHSPYTGSRLRETGGRAAALPLATP